MYFKLLKLLSQISSHEKATPTAVIQVNCDLRVTYHVVMAAPQCRLLNFQVVVNLCFGELCGLSDLNLAYCCLHCVLLGQHSSITYVLQTCSLTSVMLQCTMHDLAYDKGNTIFHTKIQWPSMPVSIWLALTTAVFRPHKPSGTISLQLLYGVLHKSQGVIVPYIHITLL